MSESRGVPTVRDVAREAGVSHMTVARVFAGNAVVSVGTRERVMSAAARLGYRPNAVARSLAQARTRTLGLVMQGGLWFAEGLRGAEETAEAQDYSFLQTRPRSIAAVERGRLEVLRQHRVDGMLLMGASSAWQHDHLEELHTDGVRLVTINRYCPDFGFTRIFFDYRSAAAGVVQRLIDGGHRHIGWLGGTPEHPQQAVRERLRGYRDALLDTGLWNPAAEALGDAAPEDGEELAQLLIERCPAVTALVTVNDLSAAGALRAFRRLGRRVPEDIAVVALDDTAIAPCTDPPLTAVRHAAYEAGKTGCQLLIERIENPDLEPRTLHLPSTLVVRGSCGLRLASNALLLGPHPSCDSGEFPHADSKSPT